MNDGVPLNLSVANVQNDEEKHLAYQVTRGDIRAANSRDLQFLMLKFDDCVVEMTWEHAGCLDEVFTAAKKERCGHINDCTNCRDRESCCTAHGFHSPVMHKNCLLR